MEKIGEDRPEKKLNSQTAIRCAKAAILLSSLKNVAKISTTDPPKLQDEDEIEKLRIELVKEKQKLKNLKYWIGVLVLNYFFVVAIYPLVLSSVLFAS